MEILEQLRSKQKVWPASELLPNHIDVDDAIEFDVPKPEHELIVNVDV